MDDGLWVSFRTRGKQLAGRGSLPQVDRLFIFELNLRPEVFQGEINPAAAIVLGRVPRVLFRRLPHGIVGEAGERSIGFVRV